MIVLLKDVECGGVKHNLYYYEGNFYYPLFVAGFQHGRVRRAIREFKKANQSLIDTDRAQPDYKTLVELFDEQFPEG